jgi:hypothetical protein
MQIVVVKDHHLARGTALDIKLDAIRPFDHGAPEGRQGVFGFKRARATMGKNPRPLAAGQGERPPLRLPHHRALAL